MRVWIIGALAIALLTYTVLRAVTVSFSWDESWTFVHHVRPGMFYQEAYDKMGGNHHLLNVWGMWVCMKLFGTSEFSLRLPNLLAHICYLYASARIVHKAGNIWLVIACFLLLNLHPYLLDFFSLARGYGLSYGFMMLSLWQMLRYAEAGSRRSLVLATVFAALSALSHVIMVNYLLGLEAALMTWWLFQHRAVSLRARAGDLLWSVAITLAGLGVMLPNALGLFQGGSLNVGCETLWQGTARTLGEKFLYHQPYVFPPLEVMGWVLGSILLWVLIAGVIFWRSREIHEGRPMVLSILVFAFIFLSMGLQRILFGVFWPQSRTALFLMVLILVILATTLIYWRGRTWLPSLVAGLLYVPLLYHATQSMNPVYAVEWKPSGELRRMLDVIRNDHLPFTTQRPVVTVSSSDESWGCLHYYRVTHDLPWLLPRHRVAPDPFAPADYYIVEFDGHDQVDSLNWTRLFHSEVTNTSLYRDERSRGSEQLLALVENNMEATSGPGVDTIMHAGGQRSLKFDEGYVAAIDLSWVVPEGADGGPVTIVGTAMVHQPSEDNWLAMMLSVAHDGKAVESFDLPTEPQIVHFNAWTPVGIKLRTTTSLLPGDCVALTIWPTWTKGTAAMHVDDMKLSVLR